MPRILRLLAYPSLALAFLAGPPPALADEHHPPLLDELELERRLSFGHLTVLTLHRAPNPDDPNSALPAVGHPASRVEVGTLGPARPESLAVQSEASRPIALIPGLYARGPQDDFVLTRYRVVGPDSTVELALTEASTEGGDTRPALLDAMAPPHLRYHAITRGGQSEVRETVQRWGRALELDEDEQRVSAVDLGDHDLLRIHRDTYVLKLAQPFTAPPGRATVGYVAFFGDEPVIVELFDEAVDFRQAWPLAANALADEAALIAASTSAPTPTAMSDELWEFRTRSAQEVIARLREATVDEDERSERHTSLRMTLPRGAALGLADHDGRTLHLLYVRDPAERTVVPLVDQFDPAEAGRRARSTAEERRLLERRGERTDGPRDIEGRSRAPSTEPGR